MNMERRKPDIANELVCPARFAVRAEQIAAA